MVEVIVLNQAILFVANGMLCVSLESKHPFHDTRAVYFIFFPILCGMLKQNRDDVPLFKQKKNRRTALTSIRNE